ncbi:MAG: hypothetical protein BBJ57_08625 [Desulfobacterales bacterium PC51MH44]|nr:MAG: hypothetical protein BBJ57_08625 [Desulfobacterales bacterium PC51MH44]
MKNSWLELAVRWFLGLTFIYVSYHKIIAPAHFAKIIYGYYLFPDFSINLIAIVLPFLELCAGLALILGIYPRSAALIILGMLFVFMIAISINLSRGMEFDCGCFSFSEAGYTYSAWQLLIRDIFYFACGLQVLFFDQSRRLCLRQSGGLLKNISSQNQKTT